jgi:hypothetical protein
LKVVALDEIDEFAAVTRGEDACNLVLEVQAFSEHERWH